jgi:hypothetical protein
MILLLCAAAAGVGTGIYLSSPTRPPDRGTDPGVPAAPATREASFRRFALTALDAKDQIEAPSLACDAAGRVYLAWASKTADDERTVFLARTTDQTGTFGDPKPIARAGIYRTSGRGKKGGGYERRATPHVAVDAGRVILSWSEARPDEEGMRMAIVDSTDGGESFSQPRMVHRGDGDKPTFTGMAVGPGGAVACCWLDDRSGSQEAYASIRHAGREAFEAEERVHAGEPGVGVCPCCPTSAVFAPDGTLFVAFRDVKSGYRDIAVSRKKPGAAAFEAAVPVTGATWKFDGCPHDGPSLAIVGGALHIVWMDARSGTPRCWHGRATLEDLTFEVHELSSAPAKVAQGNARLEADADGGVHAVWEESLGEPPVAGPGHVHSMPTGDLTQGRVIMHSYMPAGASRFGPARSIAPRPGSFQTRPTLACGPAGVVHVAWFELAESGKELVVGSIPPGATHDRR